MKESNADRLNKALLLDLPEGTPPPGTDEFEQWLKTAAGQPFRERVLAVNKAFADESLAEQYSVPPLNREEHENLKAAADKVLSQEEEAPPESDPPKPED